MKSSTLTARNTVLSLYTGAGGLDLGLEAAGFNSVLCVEQDEDARKTLTLNRPKWRLSYPGDIFKISNRDLLDQAELKPRQLALLAGGPPCQPFSKSGYWSNGDAPRLHDPRALTLVAFLKVVEATLPQVLLLENVKGLDYNGKREGLLLLKQGLKSINRRKRTSYSPQVFSWNAAQYGVPQIRERLFLIAHIDGAKFVEPPPTHGSTNGLESYMTAWDAIGDLDHTYWSDDLNPRGRWAGLLPSIPEGKNYLWHTPRNQADGAKPLFGWRTRFWSFLLKLSKRKPSWTIQAAPGPATGPFHWRSRLLSIEELLRLQTFPDAYTIVGTRRSAHRQIGNAVPSAIGELLGLEIRRQIFGERVRRKLKLLPTRKTDYPGSEKITPVPESYLIYCDKHSDHPGTGYGPAARSRGSTGI